MRSFSILTTAIVACGLAAISLAAPSRSVKFTVAGYTGTTELANFPVLVKVAERDATAGTGISGFSYSDLASPSTGGDLWFSADAAGAQVIPHDIDEWHADGTSLVWVGLPRMANGTSFYMHYGDAAPPPCAPSNVWLNAGYIGVWHMNEASGNVADATGHGLTAIPKGTRAATDSIGTNGVIGVCRQNSRSGTRGSGNNNCFLQVAPAAAISAIDGCCTASQWIKLTEVDHRNVRPYSRKTSYSEGGGFECEITAPTATIRAGGTSNVQLSLSPVGQWVHLAAVYDGTLCYAYGNGGATSKSGTISSIGRRTDTGYGIGSDADGSEICINGWMDEYRLRGAVSSADWVKAEYDTATASGFLSASAAVDGSSAVVVAGSPEEYGSPSPGYGCAGGYAAGDPVRLTAPAAVFLNAAETTRVVCDGWKRYDRATGALVAESASGDDPTVCAFPFSAPAVVAWQWRRQHLVSVAASAGGSATASFWADEGATASVSATPEAGRSFYCWDADTDALGVSRFSASISFAVSGPVALSAMFLGNETAAKTYSGANNGSWDVASNWTPAGVPTISDDVTIPNGRRVAAGRRVYAHSVTLVGSGAISQGGATTAYDASCDFTGSSNYGSVNNYGRKTDDFTSTTPFLVDVLGDVSMAGSSQWIVGGHNSPAYKTVSIGGDLTLSGTAEFAVYAGKGNMAAEPEKGGAVLSVAGKATFGSGTVLDAFCNVNVVGCEASDRASGAYVLLSFGETEVASGATIRSRIGVAMMTDAALVALGCPASSGNSLAGGGHGGRGGASGATPGGAAFDSELAPILPGAAGSLARTFGGGVVRLDTGALTLDGTVSASAFFGGSQHERGAPAGGSVWITCDSFTPGENFALTADGQNGVSFQSYNIGGGAGGRIAVATGLSAAQKTELARTGTTDDISAATSLLLLYPGNVSVNFGTGVLNGTDGEAGTAVIYSYLDSSQVSVSVATSPAGLDAAGFSPSVNAVEYVARGGSFSASAPASIAIGSGTRRLATGWVATRAADGTVFAQGDGTMASIPEVTENLTLTWRYETLQHEVVVQAVGDGAVSGAATGWFNAGATLSLAAAPAAGAAFRGWFRGTFLTESEAASPTLSVPVDRPLKVAAVFTGAPSLAAKTFVGASGGSWDDAANWSPAGVPNATNAVAIPDGTVVAVGESALAGSLALGAGATLSVFGATTAFYQTMNVMGVARASLGRPAADYADTGTCPSVEVVGDFTAGSGAAVAVGGLHQRGQSVVVTFGNLALGADARLSVYAGQTVPGRVAYADGTGAVRVVGTLSLATNALLDLVGYCPDLAPYGTISCVPVACGALDVAAGARVTANFPYGFVPGSPVSVGVGGDVGRVAGGGHGGAGGSAEASVAAPAAAGGAAWDSPYAPLYPGSMGRAHESMGSIGGGAIRICAGHVALAGEINADAVYVGPYEHGGAAGGSIWIACDSLSVAPTARLSARGMDGGTYNAYSCGGGGGGRISICKGLSARRLAALMGGAAPGSGVKVTDCAETGAPLLGIGDVSGGAAVRNADDGGDGTFLLLTPASLRLLVR